MPDPYGRALRDGYRDERTEPLLERYGDEVVEHAPTESVYFNEFAPESDDAEWVASWLDGPLLDMGAGVGRHALYFQERFETVAIEVSDHLVETMRERGVEDARKANMFALCDHFERDRFRSALVIGTQVSLAGSMQGIRAFLGDLAHVTAPDATAVLDGYHPEWTAEQDVPGYRHDPTPGLAYRIQQFEYEGEIGTTAVSTVRSRPTPRGDGRNWLGRARDQTTSERARERGPVPGGARKTAITSRTAGRTKALITSRAPR